MRLSKKFPNILFTIKSKQNGWLKDRYYSSSINEIDRIDNINIYRNTNFCKNLDLINNYDIAIGLYTSGLDDFLNYRKPVLLFDPKHFFSKNINYDSNIVTDNYEDLEKKITFLIDDFEGALLKQKKTKDYLFQDFDKNNYIKLLDNHIFKNIE